MPQLAHEADPACAADLMPGQAMLVDWSAEEYFADRTALTRSSLGVLAKSPRSFLEQWEENPLGFEPKDAKSRSLTFGTNGHLAVLEPGEWSRRTGVPEIPKPKGARKGTALHAQWLGAVKQRERLMMEIPDRIDVSFADFSKIHQLASTVWSHPEAAALLGAPGYTEQTVLWRHPETGLLLKARIDRLSAISYEVAAAADGIEVGIAVNDLKTTGDPDPWPFGLSVRKFGYTEQTAIYTDIVQALYPGELVNFYIIAVRSSKHFEAMVYRLPPEAIAIGRENYTSCLFDLLDRRFTNNWLHPWERGVSTLPVPLWRNRR